MKRSRRMDDLENSSGQVPSISRSFLENVDLEMIGDCRIQPIVHHVVERSHPSSRASGFSQSKYEARAVCSRQIIPQQRRAQFFPTYPKSSSRFRSHSKVRDYAAKGVDVFSACELKTTCAHIPSTNEPMNCETRTSENIFGQWWKSSRSFIISSPLRWLENFQVDRSSERLNSIQRFVDQLHDNDPDIRGLYERCRGLLSTDSVSDWLFLSFFQSWETPS